MNPCSCLAINADLDAVVIILAIFIIFLFSLCTLGLYKIHATIGGVIDIVRSMLGDIGRMDATIGRMKRRKNNMREAGRN